MNKKDYKYFIPEKLNGKIHVEMLKPISERVMFKLVEAGTPFRPVFIKGLVEVVFEEAEKLGLIKLII